MNNDQREAYDKTLPEWLQRLIRERECGIPAGADPVWQPKTALLDDICLQLRHSGATYVTIGKLIGRSRERARQLTTRAWRRNLHRDQDHCDCGCCRYGRYHPRTKRARLFLS